MTNCECSAFNESTVSNYQCRWVGYKSLSQSKTWQVEARSLVVLYVALKVAWNIFLKYVKQYRWIMWNVLSFPSCLHCQWSWRSCHPSWRKKAARKTRSCVPLCYDTIIPPPDLIKPVVECHKCFPNIFCVSWIFFRRVRKIAKKGY